MNTSDLIIGQTQDKILDWARERELLSYENHPKQLMKVIEELGELSKAILNDDDLEIEDGLGDVGVTLIILADQLGYDFYSTIADAYEVIKERSGKTVGGTFIKD